jgi:hypothetical protein
MIYIATITEYNGEQEYPQKMFIEADNFEQASKITNKIANKFYPNCKYNQDDDKWELKDGFIQWEVTSIEENIFEFIYTKDDGYFSRLKFEKV